MSENTCTRLLQTVLTPGEHIERAEAMAQKMKDIASLEEQLKAASAGIKAKIVTAKKEMKLLGEIVATGSEEREIECRIDKDWEHKEIVVVRLDNNEVIEKRTMTASEAQADLLDRGAQEGKLIPIDGGAGAEPDGGGEEGMVELGEEERAHLSDLDGPIDGDASAEAAEEGEGEEGEEAPASEPAATEDAKPTGRRSKRNA